MAIYIVEDELNIAEIEAYVLRSSGYEVECFENGTDFLNACRKELPQLAILDIMLPGQDGISLLKTLRGHESTKEIPVILVTAKSSEMDKVKGLEVGADDYLTKPFGTMELAARVKALLRRSEKQEKSDLIQYKEIQIDEDKHEVRVQGEPVNITYKEYELLKYLIINKEIVMSREKLLENVWGYDYEGESRTVDIHVNTLRKKLGKQGEYIKTIRSVGYKVGE
ncbi:response regulator [Parasporobacterium paucivorans]|uniref:Stage 0 sporulation protein A homolog n=1 Tax=Parasporobacterium paucivorans DSM 15970 TaxID=1122934 RepID=A0A1M6D7J4_9FIRM|nr:response regulator transcription factor [Parasporobacterium paucivorans]SHI69170.1 two-component system, OmpR family, alkaline phosphatase synthesis response regulator PhoP [Parasporobacterium paucivorans DSM 15970]